MNSIPIHIPKDLFEPAAIRHYEAELSPFCLSVGIDEYSFDKPLHWQVDITNTGGALLVAGTVEGTARGICARCLEDAVFDVVGEIEGYFLIPGVEADLDDIDEDEFDTLPADDVLDMVPLIEAALILEMPLVPVCTEDCKGLCAKCGKNLNEGECDCVFEDALPLNPFAALKDFKFE
ncbi:DUF177 domain-containing protein [Adlercreutzia sp. ZJ154]|uniref:YceD family protein n=1 Tax=Adlercreutzia sp. ZJ154 TaxID=2709790 RepID=UPI0013EB8419|nr:DUF177 domain-containing protein [Adlercreutzia sp. ZJ154]